MAMDSQKYQSNIWKLYLMKALGWFFLITPIIVIFYESNGLTLRETFFLQAIFSVSIVVLEVPSGYLGDLMGRKASIVIGATGAFLGFGLIAIADDFWGFACGEFILGTGVSFISGSDSALLYDTLLELNQTGDYKKREGRYTSIGNFSEALASIAGGALAALSLRLPFYLQTAIALAVFPIALTLQEPPRNKLDNTSGNFQAILKIVKFSLNDHLEIKWLIIYSSLVNASTLTMAWLSQPYFQLVGLPLALFGVLWATFQFSVGIFALTAHQFEAFFGRRISLIALILFSAAGYLLVASFQALWGIALLLIFQFVRGICGPVIKDYINVHIKSEIRATVLSVNNLMFRLFFSLIGPFIGWLYDLYSLKTALFCAAGIFLLPGLVALFFLRKHQAL